MKGTIWINRIPFILLVIFLAYCCHDVYKILKSPERDLKKSVTISAAQFAELKRLCFRVIGKSQTEISDVNFKDSKFPSDLLNAMGLRNEGYLMAADDTIAAVAFVANGSRHTRHYGIIVGSVDKVPVESNYAELRWLVSQWDECTWYYDDFQRNRPLVSGGPVGSK